MKYLVSTIGVLLCLSFAVTSAQACDPCALYAATKLVAPEENSFSLSLSEQYTNYRRVGGDRFVGRNAELTRGFSTTQLSLGYDYSDSIGAQLTLPLVIRSFDEIDDFRESNGSETKFGDIALLASYSPIVIREVEYATIFTLGAGVKLPTGDTGALDEGVDGQALTRAVPTSPTTHHQIAAVTGLNGRILTAGTGSTDVLFTANILSRYQRGLFLGSVQYGLRGEGDFDYRFDNDLVWSAGPGFMVLLDDDYSVTLQLAMSGEHKGQDTYQGHHVDESQVSNLYLGPSLLWTLKNQWSGEISWDSPIQTNGTSATIVPDYRIRASLSFRF